MPGYWAERQRRVNAQRLATLRAYVDEFGYLDNSIPVSPRPDV
jgi:hypothetical protein